MKQETQLIFQVKSGKTEAFSCLVDLHKDKVYYQALQMVKNKQDAEEVAQDTFIKAFKCIKQFRGDSKFSTWLYKIAHFTALNYLRKRKQTDPFNNNDQIHSENDSALDQLAVKDRNQYLKKALDELRTIDRKLIVLFYLEELSIKEISKITLLSSSNIKVRLMRTKKQLFANLSGELKNEMVTLLKN